MIRRTLTPVLLSLILVATSASGLWCGLECVPTGHHAAPAAECHAPDHAPVGVSSSHDCSDHEGVSTTPATRGARQDLAPDAAVAVLPGLPAPALLSLDVPEVAPRTGGPPGPAHRAILRL